MCAIEYPMKQWVKSTTIAGRLSENWEPIVHSLDCSGGIKTRLEMTTLQHSLKLLRNLDRMFVLRSKLKSTTTAIVSSKEKAQPTFALSCRHSTKRYTRRLMFGVSKMLNSTCSWARNLLIHDSSFWIQNTLSQKYKSSPTSRCKFLLSQKGTVKTFRPVYRAWTSRTSSWRMIGRFGSA